MPAYLKREAAQRATRRAKYLKIWIDHQIHAAEELYGKKSPRVKFLKERRQRAHRLWLLRYTHMQLIFGEYPNYATGFEWKMPRRFWCSQMLSQYRNRPNL